MVCEKQILLHVLSYWRYNFFLPVSQYCQFFENYDPLCFPYIMIKIIHDKYMCTPAISDKSHLQDSHLIIHFETMWHTPEHNSLLTFMIKVQHQMHHYMGVLIITSKKLAHINQIHAVMYCKCLELLILK